MLGERDTIQWSDVAPDAADSRTPFERALAQIVRRQGSFVGAFPDATLLRLDSGRADDPVYTLIRNKAHLNIDFMFLEEKARVPAEDTLHLVRGVVASRPNLFLRVRRSDYAQFAADVLALPGALSWAKFLDRYGVRRSDSGFWATSDFFNQRFSALDPLGAGILDLSRYVND